MSEASDREARSSAVLDAVRARRSWSKVTDAAPTDAELVTLLSAAGRVADHSTLRPWRVIELRGDDRLVLGAAMGQASGDGKPSTKPLRAPVLLAIVASYKKSDKVPRWEQEAVAAGVAHTLSLLLDEAGWGVIWRTGGHTRSAPVAAVHGLGPDEELLGWLYVGGKPERAKPGRRAAVDARAHLTRMPGVTTVPDELVASQSADASRDAAEKAARKAAKRAAEAERRAAKAERKAQTPVDWDERAAKAEKKARHAEKKARHAEKDARHAEKKAQKAAERARKRTAKAAEVRARAARESGDVTS